MLKKILSSLSVSAMLLIGLLSATVMASSSLFHAFSLSESGKRDFVIDQIYFSDTSPPQFSGVNDHSSIYHWFSSSLGFVTDGKISGTASDARISSMLDDAYKVIFTSPSSDILINNKPLPYKGDHSSLIVAFLHKGGSSNLEKQLSPPGKSAYRLANYFGLSKVAELVIEGRQPFRQCRDILGSSYTCDNLQAGPFDTMGISLNHYLKNCLTCTDSDKLILEMVSAHHLLRSNSKSTRRIGEALVHRNKKRFSQLDISYEQLHEIYLRSLSSTE